VVERGASAAIIIVRLVDVDEEMQWWKEKKAAVLDM
jgi:hypothetical protein